MSDPRIRILAIAAKVQSALHTDSVPTLADNAIILTGIPGLQINYIEDGNRDEEVHGGFGSVGSDGVGGRWGQIDISLNLRGAGEAYAAATLPECHPFLIGSGLQHTVVTTEDAEKVTYTDTDDADLFKNFSMYLWSARKLFKMVDCVFVPKIGAEAGKRGMLTGTVVGVITSITQANITTTTYSQVAAPKFVSGEIAIGDFDKTSTPGLVCQRIALDFGVKQILSPGAGSEQGIDAFEITDFQHMLEMDIQVPPLATWNPFVIGEEGTGEGSTDRKVAFQIGSAQYNRIKIATGQWGFRPVAPTDFNGLAIYKLSGKIAAKTASNDRSTLITFD